MAQLDDKQVAKLQGQLRKADGSPAVPRPPEPQADPVVITLEKVVAALEELYKRPNTVIPSTPAGDILASTIVKMLKQNAELLQLVSDKMEIDAHEDRMEDEREPQEWAFTVETDERGRITKILAKEC